jgi:hypothetical protein
MNRILLTCVLAFAAAFATTPPSRAQLRDLAGPELSRTPAPGQSGEKSEQERDGGKPDTEHHGRPCISCPLGPNQVLAWQTGDGNIIQARQQGQANFARINQTGAFNRIELDQVGRANIANVSQNGIGLSALIEQFGNGNRATIVQGAGAPSAVVRQYGDHGSASLIQH